MESFDKCLWSHNGQQIRLGDDQEKLYLYDVNEFLTNPKQDDFNKLTSILQKFKRNTFDDNHPTSVTATSTTASVSTSVNHSS